MYTREEKISRLMEVVNNCDHFVMAGSMDSFHEYFDPFFELVIYLHADKELRVKRVKERAENRFGKHVLPGGDMYEQTLKNLNDIAGYDIGIGGMTLQQHEKWLSSLQCKIIRLDGGDILEDNRDIIINAYRGIGEL